MSSEHQPCPFVRVEDASMLRTGGPVRLSLTDVPEVRRIAEAVASAHGVCTWNGPRLVVSATPDRLVAAAGRAGGAPLAELVQRLVTTALAGWQDAPADLRTSGPDLRLHERPAVMAVLNVTPDSFSDGGQYLAADGGSALAIEAGLAFAVAGADVIDVGGVSTRPGAAPVDVEEELRRVVPVVDGLSAQGVLVSVDTTSAAVARAAIDAGAAIVNDVSAGRLDPDLLATVADAGAGYVLMHMQGTPATMQADPTYDDVVAEVAEFLARGLVRVEEAGIDLGHVAVDPGIGFGKTVAHNLTLIARLREFRSLGRPVLLGSSRKRFIGTITGTEDPGDRLPGSLAVAAISVANGAAILRVHDVPETVQAVRVAHAVATA